MFPNQRPPIENVTDLLLEQNKQDGISKGTLKTTSKIGERGFEKVEEGQESEFGYICKAVTRTSKA